MAAQTTLNPIDIADAVVTDINTPMVIPTTWAAWQWLQSFTCRRLFLKDLVWTAAELATLQIGVVPIMEDDERGGEKGQGARGIVYREHMIRVYLQKTIAADADIEPLARFVFQVKDYWIARGRVFSQGFLNSGGRPLVTCFKTQVKASYNPKAVSEHMQWGGMVDLWFKEWTAQ